MRLIGPADYRHMKWKNGGGSTTKIAVSPPRAGLDDFDWRISMATVADAGPFSRFPGIDRTLAVLQGNGIRLDVDGTVAILTRESAPLSFAADAPVHGTPVDGPITDLNVMTRRGRYRHAVTHNHVSARLAVRCRGTTSLIFTANACRVGDGSTAIDLAQGATVLIENAHDRSFDLATEGEAEIYLIDLFRD